MLQIAMIGARLHQQMGTLDVPGKAVPEQIAARAIPHSGLVAAREVDQVRAQFVNSISKGRRPPISAVMLEISAREEAFHPKALGRFPGAKDIRVLEREADSPESIAQRIAHIPDP